MPITEALTSSFTSSPTVQLDACSRESSGALSEALGGDAHPAPLKTNSFMLRQKSCKSDLSRASSLSQAVSEKTGASSIEDLGPCIRRQSLSLRRPVGSGAFAEVHVAELKDAQPELLKRAGSPSPCPLVAVKQLKGSVHEAEVVNFIEEAMIMQSISHENIIQVVGMGSDDSTTSDAQWKSFFLVQEFATGGSLRTLLYKQMISFNKPIYSFRDALRWSLNIAAALQFLHNHTPAIIHRDLKCDNILLTGPKNCLTAKIGDFGLSKCIQPLTAGQDDSGTATTYELTGKTGAFVYMAPEVMQGQPYNEKVDVFSFAVVMYELFTKSLISAQYANTMERDESEDHAVKVAAGFRPPFPSYVPDSICGIINRCWSTDPRLRPSMTQVLAELKAVEASGVVDSMDDALSAVTSKKCCMM